METYDLVVIGGTAAGLSLATEASASGLQHVLVLEAGASLPEYTNVGGAQLLVRFHAKVTSVHIVGDEIEVELEESCLRAKAVAYAVPLRGEPAELTIPVAETVADRVVFGRADVPSRPSDVLVVGGGELAVDQCIDLVQQGHRVVVSFDGRFEELSVLSQQVLTRLEADRRATILWHSDIESVEDVGGFPMVVFAGRRTPDLQFDFVLFNRPVSVTIETFTSVGVKVEGVGGNFFVLQDRGENFKDSVGTVVPSGTAWDYIRAVLFPGMSATHRHLRSEDQQDLVEQLYNAEITRFEKAHSDLWLIRVRPDDGQASFRAGQYATLGLGYWEDRIDGAVDVLKEGQLQKLVRRSYSISSSILDDRGYLLDPAEQDELEFYIVLVPVSPGRIPALTPRLAMKSVGDRIYLGPKISGRYTLDSVNDPSSAVLLLSTGTGEAPHNAMIGELLRKGHYGPIVSLVSVRKSTDLGYQRTHDQLSERYPNYHYVPLPTREPGVDKTYIQQVLSSGRLQELGVDLDPATTTVFLCGNPAMIGPPEWDGDSPTFPEVRGAVEILHEKGFVVDRRGTPGNVHFEEYW